MHKTNHDESVNRKESASRLRRFRLLSPGRMLLIGLIVITCGLALTWWGSRASIRAFEARGVHFGDWGFTDPFWIRAGGFGVGGFVLGNGRLSRLVPDEAVNYITLSGKQFDDQCCKDLAGLHGLKSLHLIDTGITDADLKVICAAPFDLVSIHFYKCDGLTDAGLAHLSAQSAIFYLEIHEANISGVGLAKLSSLPLMVLRLQDCAFVTERGLSHLPKFKALENLILKGTSVTDASLVHIAAMTSLKEVALSGTKVTAGGVEQLQRRRPRLSISHY